MARRFSSDRGAPHFRHLFFRDAASFFQAGQKILYDAAERPFI
jgi:hypothetical protein